MSNSGWGGPSDGTGPNGHGADGPSAHDGGQQGGRPGQTPPWAQQPQQPGDGGQQHGQSWQQPGQTGPQGQAGQQGAGWQPPGQTGPQGQTGQQGAGWQPPDQARPQGQTGPQGAGWQQPDQAGPQGQTGPQGQHWQQPGANGQPGPGWQPGQGGPSPSAAPQYGGPPQGPGPSPQWPQPGPGEHPAPPQKKRPWALFAVAASCIVAMILVVGGGITYLALSRGGEEPVASDPATTGAPEPDDSEASPTTEPSEYSEFRVLGLGEFPEATPEELLGVMQDNPLTEGGLPDVGTCDLPATPAQPSAEQLQAVLDAAAGCLNQVWSVASSDRGLPWVTPEIVVYTWPDVPSSSSCEPDTFAEDFPRMCNLDATIYWPVGYGIATDLENEENVPGAYLWDLAHMYSNATSWNSTLVFYQREMRDQFKDTDPERDADAWRRNALQWVCWASAASMQVPSGAQPSPELRDALASPEAWNEGEPPENIAPENRAQWIAAGFDSGGDLAKCNTWTAEVETVS